MAAIESKDEAARLARELLADLGLFSGAPAGNPAAAEQLAEARALFRSRVVASLHPVFDAVLEARPAAASGAAPRARLRVRPLTVAWVLIALAAGAIVVWRYASAGRELGSIRVPGAATFEVPAGAVLSFRADTDVLFRDFSHDALPEGCELSLALVRDGREIERAACDLYSSGRGASIARAATYETDGATGLRRLRVEGQRLACSLRPRSGGRVTIQADSTLATCVPRALGAVVHVVASR